MSKTQYSHNTITSFGNTPRTARNWDKTGKYELVPFTSNTSINRGDSVVIDIFITGYGQISDSKIYFSLPTAPGNGQIESSVEHGIQEGAKDAKTTALIWGGKIDKFDKAFVINLTGGFQMKSWAEPTLIFDAHPNDPGNNTLTSEQSMGGTAPFRIIMNFNKKVKAGVYNVSCILTYYNGESWQNSSFQLGLTVRNRFQQYEGWVSILGIIAAVGSSTGIVALIIQLWQLLCKA